MMQRFFLCFLLVICVTAVAQEERAVHYSGGMYYGSGVHHFSTPLISESIITNYVGGRLAFLIGKYFKAGIMGGNIFKYYDEKGSYYKIGHGGLTGEFNYRIKRLNAGAGVMIGGAKYRNLYVTGLSGNSLSGDFMDGSFMFAVPFVTASYNLTSKLAVSFMAEHFNDALFSSEAGISGTNIKIGILFNR